MASSTVPELYMYPTSYYSQKVRIALREKKIKHTEAVIDITAGEQNTTSYFKLNPNGEVPMLRIGDQYFIGSEKLIEIVDQLPSDCNIKLVPAEKTPEGQDVAAWRAKLHAVDIVNLTFGVLLNPELSLDGILHPEAYPPNKEAAKAGLANAIKKLEEIQEKYPDLRESCQRKIQLCQQRSVSYCDKDNCARIMNGLDSLMNDVEKQLQSKTSGQCQYLCGPNLTAADIILWVLLGRLTFLGICSRYADSNKRPALYAYWNAAKRRPYVDSLVLNDVAEAKLLKKQ